MLLHSSWTDDGDNNCIQIPTNWCLVCLVTCRPIHKSDFVHVTQSATPSMSPDQKCNSHRCNVQNNNNNNYIIFTGQWLVVCAPCVGISKPHNRTLNGLTKLHSTALHHNPILNHCCTDDEPPPGHSGGQWKVHVGRILQPSLYSTCCPFPSLYVPKSHHVTINIESFVITAPDQCVVVRTIVCRWYVHSIALTQCGIPLSSPIESEYMWTGFV